MSNNSIGPVDIEFALKNINFQAEAEKMKQGIRGVTTTTQQEATKTANAFKGGFGGVDKMLDGIGLSVTGLIGPAAAVAAAFKFKQLAQEAYEFEMAYGMAMREVQTISKATQDDFEGISQSIVDLAANGPDDAIKLAKAYYQIVSAGHDGAAGLELLSVASKAATAGVTDTLTAADGLTTVINAWALSSDQANAVADVMFKTVERGKTTFAQLASNIAQVAPLASANGIGLNEIFAALQTITKQGTPTAQAMTQIRSSIINMNNSLGDGWSKTMTYQDGLNKIAEMAGGSSIELKKLIPDVEGMSAVLALTGEKAKGAAEDLSETTKAAGSMETAYGRMMEEADNKWSVVHNKWTREVRELGKAMKEESGNLANFMDALLSDGSDVKTDMTINGIAEKIKALRIMGGSFIGSYIMGGLMPENAVRAQYDQYVKTIQNYATQGLDQQQTKLGDILGIKNKDERLTKLNEFLKSLKESEQDLGNTVLKNDEQQKAALKVRAELWGNVEAKAKAAVKEIENTGGGGGAAKLKTLTDINKAIEEAKKNQESSTSKAEFDNFQKTIDKLEAEKTAITGIQDKKSEAAKKEKEDIKSTIEASEEYLAIQQKIVDKLKELDKANQQKNADMGMALVQEVEDLKRQLSALTKQPTIKAQSGTISSTPYDTTKLAHMKQLTAEQRTQLELQAKAADKEQKRAAAQEAWGEVYKETIYYLDQIIGKYSEQLGLTEQQTKILESGMNAANALARGDYFGAAISGFETAIGAMMDTSGIEKKLTQPWIEFENWVARSNDVLERYIKLRDEAIGSERYTTSDQAIKEAEDIKAEAEAKLNDMKLSWTFKDSGWLNDPYKNIDRAINDLQNKLGGGLKMEGDEKEWGIAGAWKSVKQVVSYDLSQMTKDTEGNFSLDKLRKLIADGTVADEAVAQAVSDYDANMDKLINLQKEKQQLLTDTMASSIADSIIEGFKNGYDSAADFAGNFEDLMRNAILNSLKIKTLEEPLKLWYDQFSKDMESGGGLDQSERDQLNTWYNEIIANGKAATDAAFSAAGVKLQSSSTSSAMTGISASLTEDTGSALVGQLMAVRVDIKDILKQVAMGQDDVGKNLLYLKEIAFNTSHNVRLIKIEEGITEMNKTLKDRL